MKQQVISTRLSNNERETHYLIEYTSDSIVAETTIMRDYTKMMRQGWTLIKQYTYPDGTIVGGCFEAPRNALSIRNVMAEKRVATVAQMEAIKKARAKRLGEEA